MRIGFPVRERLQIARLVLPESGLSTLDPRTDRDRFRQVTDRAWAALAWSWTHRLAVSDVPHAEVLGSIGWPSVPIRPDLWQTPFAATPPELCRIFHSMDVWDTDRQFLSEWHRTGDPVVVLNYRDPRDALLSFADFLSGKGSPRGWSASRWRRRRPASRPPGSRRWAPVRFPLRCAPCSWDRTTPQRYAGCSARSRRPPTAPPSPRAAC